MNRVRKLAEDLVNRYPTLFTTDFEKNKEALEQVSVVRTRSLRNQLAGAITKLVHQKQPPPSSAEGEETVEEDKEPATLGERAEIKGAPAVVSSSEHESAAPQEQKPASEGTKKKTRESDLDLRQATNVSENVSKKNSVLN